MNELRAKAQKSERKKKNKEGAKKGEKHNQDKANNYSGYWSNSPSLVSSKERERKSSFFLLFFSLAFPSSFSRGKGESHSLSFVSSAVSFFLVISCSLGLKKVDLLAGDDVLFHPIFLIYAMTLTTAGRDKRIREPGETND